jgi:hypothetical protein
MRSKINYFDILESRQGLFDTGSCQDQEKICGIGENRFCMNSEFNCPLTPESKYGKEPFSMIIGHPY